MASAGAVGAMLQEARNHVQDSELAIEEAAVAKNSSMYCIADLMMTCVVSAWYELMAKANNLGGGFAGAGRLCACSCSFGARLGACEWDAIHEAL